MQQHNTTPDPQKSFSKLNTDFEFDKYGIGIKEIKTEI